MEKIWSKGSIRYLIENTLKLIEYEKQILVCTDNAALCKNGNKHIIDVHKQEESISRNYSERNMQNEENPV